MTSSNPPLEVSVSPSASADMVVVSITGSLDLENVESLETRFTELAATHPRRVVVDLSGVDVMSSIAMGALLRLHHSLRANGGKLILAAVTAPVLAALRRARMDLVVGVQPTVESAISA